jgi:hypothetical protein
MRKKRRLFLLSLGVAGEACAALICVHPRLLTVFPTRPGRMYLWPIRRDNANWARIRKMDTLHRKVKWEPKACVVNLFDTMTYVHKRLAKTL